MDLQDLVDQVLFAHLAGRIAQFLHQSQRRHRVIALDQMVLLGLLLLWYLLLLEL